MTRLLVPLVSCLVAGATAAWAVRNHPVFPLFSNGGSAPVDVGPLPRGLEAIDAESCGKCHAEIAAEWRGSLHAKAWVDPVFQDAYAVEPLAECRNCHAPENGGEEPTGRAAAEGVSCATCHVRGGQVLAGSGHARGVHGGSAGSPTAGPRQAPHAVFATRALDSSQMCAGCHQFNFLGFVTKSSGGHHVETDEVQQDTWGEWSRSRSATARETCQDCHMPWKQSANGGRQYRSHAFPGGFDEALVREAVTAEVTAREVAEGVEVAVTFHPGRIGHAFPTGDLFRRAELKAWLEGSEEPPVVFPLARTFRDRIEDCVPDPQGGPCKPLPEGQVLRVRRQSVDTRVPPPGSGPPAVRRATIRLPAAADAPRGISRIRWTFDYLLMPTPGAASAGGKPVHSVHIAGGELVATPAAPRSPERSSP